MNDEWFNQVKYNDAGLVATIAQQYDSGKVLMMAWMNREALCTTIEEGRAVYYSRSRQKLWRKGEESGHIQIVKEIRIDCDSDVVLMQVDQIGGIACHTGHHSCFFRKFDHNIWHQVDPVLKSAEEIYNKEQ